MSSSLTVFTCTARGSVNCSISSNLKKTLRLAKQTNGHLKRRFAGRNAAYLWIDREKRTTRSC